MSHLLTEIENIHSHLNNFSLLRKILFIDYLKSNEEPKYDIENDRVPIYYNNGNINSYSLDDLNFTNIYINGTIINDIEFNYILEKIKNIITIKENKILYNLLYNSTFYNQITRFYDIDHLVNAIDLSLFKLESNDFIGCNLICHPKIFKILMKKEEVDLATKKEILSRGIYGHIYTLDIFVDVNIPSNNIYITPNPHFLGAVAAKNENNNFEYLSLIKNENAFSFKEEIFPAIFYPQFVQKIIYEI